MLVIHTQVAHTTSKEKTQEEGEAVKWLNNYRKVRTLGRGAFGKVSLYINGENGKPYAIKKVSKRVLQKQQQQQRRSLKVTGGGGGASPLKVREAEVLERCVPPHANVCRLVEIIDDPDSPSVYLCFEHAGRPLAEEVRASRSRSISADFLLGALHQLLKGLAHLHRHGVVHGDLKMEHLLFKSVGENSSEQFEGEGATAAADPTRFCIVDFGAAWAFDPEAREAERADWVTKSPGTPAYTAPECCRLNDDDDDDDDDESSGNVGEMSGSYSGRKADVWALGLAVYVLYYGAWPYSVAGEASDLYEELRTLREVPFPPPGVREADLVDAKNVDRGEGEGEGEGSGAGRVLSQVLRQMLRCDPALRPSAEELLQNFSTVEEIEKLYVDSLHL
mmetsp:Transcript_12124/g.30768  ORF Transcript_12124/g.30768 Transcript_12124/m.30768 type:complete len:391 (+) Transcript_12124:209-1381(+)